jgi:hypothetical protein
LTLAPTRWQVTNALHVLPACDSVSVVHNGTVAESGPYHELVASGGVLAGMVKTQQQEGGGAADHEGSPRSEAAAAAAGGAPTAKGVEAAVTPPPTPSPRGGTSTSAERKAKGALVKAETRKKGRVKFATYHHHHHLRVTQGYSACGRAPGLAEIRLYTLLRSVPCP